jgi:hypothetical protein
MRIVVMLSLVGVAACSSAAPDNREDGAPAPAHAPVTSFVPPTPRGCVAAAAYDVCVAFDDATPLAVNVSVPPGVPPGATAVAHFERIGGPADAIGIDRVKFKTRDARELHLYFQVQSGTYRVSVGVDADGDGDPEGPSDDLGAALVDVGSAPIAVELALSSPR